MANINGQIFIIIHIIINAQIIHTWLKKIGLFRPMKASNICNAKPTIMS